MKKILFLTRLDPKKIHSWSGTNYFMLQALKKNFSVITVGPLSNRIRILYVLKRFFLSIFNIKYEQCIIFQKITNDEKILLGILDVLNKK